MGDMSCNCAFSMLAVVPGSGLADATELDGTPQSSRSGRLSSSSAQSIWLLGVEGLWSMAKARTCSTSESMFVFAEELATVGAAGLAERCGGAFFDRDSLGCADDGPERDLPAFAVDANASAVEFSDDIVAPDGLLCDRRRRVDILEEVVDAESGAEAAVGDAGSTVNKGSLSTACCGARRGPSLDLSGRSTPGSGWGSKDEEEFLLALEVCDGADTIEGADLVGTGLGVGVFMFFSVVGEPRPLAPRVEVPPRRPPLPPRPRSPRLALLRPLFWPRRVELRSPVCPQSSRVEVGPAGGGMEREAMRVR